MCSLFTQVYGPLIGDQPPGEMFENYHQPISLPGFGSCNSIFIHYRFPNGTQGPDHPNPGKPYTGINEYAYLPDNKEGRKFLNF